ncbi:MAG: efflux RND transporter periplasmic adaptor subunit [Nitrococcus sp.]|nr:efflux RND transporter periplasmic adaptor subunit [Nitrococcus sp.]
MAKYMSLMVLALILVFGGIFGWKAFVSTKVAEALANSEPPPVTVSATEAEVASWQPTLPAIGTLRAVQGVDMTSEVAGRVETIEFESGTRVQQGDVLITLDASIDRAELRRLHAEEELARAALARQRHLAETNVASEAALDEALAQFKSIQAQIASQQAQIDKKIVNAPFTGTLGLRLVDIGEYLSPGDDIVTLQKLEPIYVDFALPQQFLPLVEEDQRVRFIVENYPENDFTGSIVAINPKVDSTTRNFHLRAILQNGERLLRPGMFGDVAVLLPEREQVLTLPQTAITYNPYGDSVFLVRPPPDDRADALPVVTRVFVKTGETRGDQVEIIAGVEAGDAVVTAGQLKLREGTRVIIDNTITPTSDPSPEVVNR